MTNRKTSGFPEGKIATQIFNNLHLHSDVVHKEMVSNMRPKIQVDFQLLTPCDRLCVCTSILYIYYIVFTHNVIISTLVNGTL